MGTFWERSMLVKPEDGREVICHATAWDFYDGEDVRIRMCSRDNNFEDFATIFHEMGHIQYFMQYKHQPQVFRDGANAGFHEAIGELMGMMSATQKHLHKLGLMDSLVEDEELDINFLMSQALITVTTLPFHLVNDLWRWRVFHGDYMEKEWNTSFRHPLAWLLWGERTQEEAWLDPPTLFHINQDYDMIRYFTRYGTIYLCLGGGHTDPHEQDHPPVLVC